MLTHFCWAMVDADTAAVFGSNCLTATLLVFSSCFDGRPVGHARTVCHARTVLLGQAYTFACVVHERATKRQITVNNAHLPHCPELARP